MEKYMDYALEQTKKVLSIDSPTGYTREAADYVMNAYEAMGYHPVKTIKGGVLVEIGGTDDNDAILLEAHMDTLGAMVREIKGNGRLKLSPLGGMNPNNAEAENCRIITRFNGKYEGTFQLENASIHVNGKYNDTKRSYDNMEVVLDEHVTSEEETRALGIMEGDIVAFDPRTTITEKGYIKSRFLDDKLSVGILLGFAKFLKEENIIKKANENAIYFNKIIKEKFSSHKNVGDIRSIGLINAIELVKNKSTKEAFDPKFRKCYQIYKKALKKGVLLRPLGDVIYFNPPLIIEPKDMDFVTDIAAECMSEILA